MRVIITAGGTGGHIYPALAIINKIKEKEPNSEFLYIGTHNRMEKDIVPKCGYRYEAIEIYGFSKTNIARDFKNICGTASCGTASAIKPPAFSTISIFIKFSTRVIFSKKINHNFF